MALHKAYNIVDEGHSNYATFKYLVITTDSKRKP